MTGGHAVPPGGTSHTVHTGGRWLSHKVSCIFLYLSTKSHKRWPVLQAPTLLICKTGHKKHPVVNKRKTASTYHINTANQIYIFFSYIKDITVKKDCTVFLTTDPYSLETLENKRHSPIGQIL